MYLKIKMEENITPSDLNLTGQHGEIPYVLLHKERLGIPDKGVFIELGGYDGVTASQSLWFEKNGWTGILIEPDPRYKESIVKNRNCIISFSAIGDKEGIVPFYQRNGQLSGTAGIPSLNVVQVKMKRLDKLLEEKGLDHVDYINIDTEGNELDVWDSLGKYKKTVKVVVIETHYKPDVEKAKEILERDGFKIETQLNINTVFVPKEIPPYELDYLPVVFPLHHAGGADGRNGELKYALRSWDKHYKGKIRIAIAGAHKPNWITDDVILIPCVKVHANGRMKPKGLKSSVKTTAGFFHQGFMWAYDDVVLLKDETEETIKNAHATTKWKHGGGRWQRSCFKVFERLQKEGLQDFNFSSPHGTYYLDYSMVVESFNDWGAMKGRFPFESWILNKRKCKPKFDQFTRLIKANINIVVPETSAMLNWSGNCWNEPLKKYLQEKFPEPSRWEK